MDYIFIGTMRHSELVKFLLCVKQKMLCLPFPPIGPCNFRITFMPLILIFFKAGMSKMREN